MKDISLTQTGNFTALIPVVVLVLAQFDIKITEGDITTIVASVFALVGVFTSIYGRYRQGDVSVLGVKQGEKGQ